MRTGTAGQVAAAMTRYVTAAATPGMKTRGRNTVVNYGNLIGCVAKAGGQTTARVFGCTHSQITLVANALAPASGWPGLMKLNPLPLGSPPGASRTASAAFATASGA